LILREKSCADQTDCSLRLQAAGAVGGCEPLAEKALPERALKRIPAVGQQTKLLCMKGTFL